MKKIIIFTGLLSAIAGNAQVIINGSSSAAGSVSSPSVLMEFQAGINKGIILPWNTSKPSSPSNGTFILNTVNRQVEVFENNTWRNLSADASTANPIDMTLQSSPYTENTAAKSIVGAQNTTASGIMVLESANKALVLPKVESPHLNIINPAPGMMVFDPVKELLCVYNGTQWSYWRYQ